MGRRTRQRTLISETIRQAKRPLTPAEVHSVALKEIPSLGLATVYRHVKALAEQSVVVGVDYPGQPTRYEWVDGQDKTHFTCRGCDKLFALDLPQQDERPDFDLPPGFIATGGEFIVYGLCPKCSG
jgi:Fur family ferric uptake transcriptional regulator